MEMIRPGYGKVTDTLRTRYGAVRYGTVTHLTVLLYLSWLVSLVFPETSSQLSQF
jgi:hypothetical protein